MSRTGLALPATLAVLVTAGFLVATAFHLALLDARAGRNAVAVAQTAGLLDAALLTALAVAEPAAPFQRAGDSVPVAGAEPGVGQWSGVVRYLGNAQFLVRVRVVGTGGLARREGWLLAVLETGGEAPTLRPLAKEPAPESP